jgi:hypothetical protein
VYSNSSSAPNRASSTFFRSPSETASARPPPTMPRRISFPRPPLRLRLGASRSATEASRIDSAAAFRSFCSFLSSKICLVGCLPFWIRLTAAPHPRRSAGRTGSPSRLRRQRRPWPLCSSLPCHLSSVRLVSAASIPRRRPPANQACKPSIRHRPSSPPAWALSGRPRPACGRSPRHRCGRRRAAPAARPPAPPRPRSPR